MSSVPDDPRDGVEGRATTGEGKDPSSGGPPAERPSERDQLRRLYFDERLSERQVGKRLGLPFDWPRGARRGQSP